MPASSIKRAVEIRSYEAQPGTREAFHALMSDQAVPMLRRWNVDVVAYGPSGHDADSYFLIRAYRDVAERDASQDAFYGSDEWRNGPRQAILAPIRHYTSIVMSLDEACIDALRAASPS
ncbi:NIPSNAP family protein [Lysobacter sp. M2-1]|uniref:NIPSNAP family protein n=1 Tax=Lysobacter sp. M2-1 TaxID=2916839 RepID=UPI001F5839DB|nr:NIPSNAP family protein [Lysobacter sp. M2-1]